MKKIARIIIVLLVVLVSMILFFNVRNDQKIKKEKALIKEIENHYNNYVITNKDSKLYELNNNKYIEIGNISKDIKLILSDIKIDKNALYFKIEDLDLYISYLDVDKTDEFSYNDRFKNYIPFNLNIKTKDKTNFYDDEDKLVYSINKSFDLKVIINDSDKYGVEYNNQLLYINGSDVDKLYENSNTDLQSKKNIRVITYHFLYNPDIQSCTSSICLSIYKFEDQLKYIRENNYFTLTLPELELYMDGKLRIPEKSTVLTIDDGTIINLDAIKMLDQYKVNATMFIITSVVDPNLYQAEYLDLESHTDNMHNQYECPGYGLQGGGILCLSEEKVKADLKTSQEKLGGSKYFAYPFFDWDERAIRLLKETGFHMAFVGAAGADGVSTPGVTDKFKVKRKTMFSDVSLNEFINEFLN